MSIRSLTIGLPGPTGATGAQGPSGPSGAQGPMGSAGSTGPQGSIGLTGPQGATGPAGANGSAGATGATGAAGSVPTYNSAGLVAGVKIWYGTATTGTNGVWSVNYSSAGFTAPPIVSPQPVSTSNSSANAIVSSMTAPTTTGAAGGTYIANPVTLLGLLPLQTAGAGLTIQVIAIGV